MSKNHGGVFVRLLLLLGMAAAGAVVIPSGAVMLPARSVSSVRNYAADIRSAVTQLNDEINGEIFELPKVYVLPKDQSAPPEPNPACYDEDSYQDDTITVRCSHERITLPNQEVVTVHFADVVIAHPTQLRMAFAGGSYGLTKRLTAKKMAADNHAVIAINADFYNCRATGLIVRQGTLYRKAPYGLDTLLIDQNGDFHVMNDQQAYRSEMLKNGEVYQSINFGPILVENGEAVLKTKEFHSVSGTERSLQPRTAVGQIGTLHYLLCTVDGRSGKSAGIKTNDLGIIMADKGCRTAYNLDGGQSSTMVFHDEIYNVISNGGERSMSDILYFGTAIPESEWSQTRKDG